MKLLFLFLCSSVIVQAQLYKDPTQDIERRVADLLQRMTPAEKAWQLFMVPSDFDTTKCRFTDGIFGLQLFAAGPADPTNQILSYSNTNNNIELIVKANSIQKHFIENTRLGIPIIFFDEGLHGLVRGQATAFPQAIALAASFNLSMVEEVSLQIAKEARLLGVRQILSPVLNLATDVRWGRTEETFGEDPYWASQMSLAYVRPIENSGIICTPKHFVVNVGDGGRDSYPISLGDRALYMSHYRPFLTAIQQGKARSVMSAYNSLNGRACSSSEQLIKQTLKKDWGFEGFVISDANAVGAEVVLHHTALNYQESGSHALSAGLDVIFQTDCAHFGLFEPALLDNSKQNEIDSAVARVLRVKFQLGLFEHPYLAIPNQKEIEKLLYQGHELAQKCAEESVVLLENKSVNGSSPILPLAKKSRILLIGDAATEVKLGGYSGAGFRKSNIKTGLEAIYGPKNIQYLNLPFQPWADDQYILDANNSWFDIQNGFRASYYDNPDLVGKPIIIRNEEKIDHHWTLYGPAESLENYYYSAKWEATLVGKQEGEIEIGLSGNDGYRLYINDTLFIDQWEKQGFHERLKSISVSEKQIYQLRLEFKEPQGNGRIKLFIKEQAEEDSHSYLQLEKVLDNDVAIVVVDYPEGEFLDRSSLALAPAQINLIKELKACGLPLIVVVVGGSAVSMSDWQDDADAILYNWYSGEAGGIALARILCGEVTPSGKLPITLPQNEGQLPLNYWHQPTGRGDDYTNSSGEPLYPFGYGLSYTSFQYDNLLVKKQANANPYQYQVTDTIELSFLIQNTGAYDGKEVLQFYVKNLYSNETLPVQYLIDAQKVTIKKGETMGWIAYKIPIAKLGIPTGPISIAYPTEFRIQIGSSSKEIKLQTPILQIK
jgi:beta-glucosidase